MIVSVVVSYLPMRASRVLCVAVCLLVVACCTLFGVNYVSCVSVVVCCLVIVDSCVLRVVDCVVFGAWFDVCCLLRDVCCVCCVLCVLCASWMFVRLVFFVRVLFRVFVFRCVWCFVSFMCLYSLLVWRWLFFVLFVLRWSVVVCWVRVLAPCYLSLRVVWRLLFIRCL